MRYALLVANPGRKRSEVARAAVLQATRELVVEEGFAHLTIEKIAARAHVGKPTIYRWWQSKNAILAECVLGGEVLPLTPETSAAELQASPVEWFHAVLGYVDQNAPLLRGICAAAYEDPAISSQLREHFTTPIVAALHAWASANDPGDRQTGDDQSEGLSVDALAQLIFGAVLYRLALPAGAPGDSTEHIVQTLLARYRA